jgi:hypothetical protein
MLCAVLALAALLPLGWSLRERPWLAVLLPLGLAGGTLSIGLMHNRHLASIARETAEHLQLTPREQHPGGYVTSDQCRSCHPAEYDTWHASFHRTMTTRATPATFKATRLPLDAELDGGRYRLERRADAYWAEIPDPNPRTKASPMRFAEGAQLPRVWQRIALITGSHHMQIYWTAGDGGNLQHLFPFAWLIAEQRWVPARDTFLRDPKKGHPFQHWNLNCIRCHATAGQARPEAGYQHFDTRVGELGIACEACHGPAEAHATAHRNPARRYLARENPTEEESIINPARLTREASAHVCAQCHGIRWIPAAERVDHLGFSYRPGEVLDRSTPIVRPSRLDLQPHLREPLRQNPQFLDQHYWRDGEVRVSGREFNGMVDSACYERGEMTCLSCHSMHQYLDADDQLAPDRAGNEACLQCHTQFRSSLEAHTHHRADSTGSLCYNCHMPHTTYGLLKAIRSHRVTSPNIAVSIDTGRPSACNLCHLDRTAGWTAEHLQRWYGRAPPALPPEQHRWSTAAMGALKGDAGLRALLAWHMNWSPALQASGTNWMVPHLAHLLEDPYAAVRFIAHRSLRGRPEYRDLPYDYVGASTAWPAARERALDLWEVQSNRTDSLDGVEAVLLKPEGGFDEAAFRQLLSERDDRSMDLQE